MKPSRSLLPRVRKQKNTRVKPTLPPSRSNAPHYSQQRELIARRVEKARITLNPQTYPLTSLPKKTRATEATLGYANAAERESESTFISSTTPMYFRGSIVGGGPRTPPPTPLANRTTSLPLGAAGKRTRARLRRAPDTPEIYEQTSSGSRFPWANRPASYGGPGGTGGGQFNLIPRG